MTAIDRSLSDVGKLAGLGSIQARNVLLLLYGTTVRCSKHTHKIELDRQQPTRFAGSQHPPLKNASSIAPASVLRTEKKLR